MKPKNVLHANFKLCPILVNESVVYYDYMEDKIQICAKNRMENLIYIVSPYLRNFSRREKNNFKGHLGSSVSSITVNVQNIPQLQKQITANNGEYDGELLTKYIQMNINKFVNEQVIRNDFYNQHYYTYRNKNWETLECFSTLQECLKSMNETLERYDIELSEDFIIGENKQIFSAYSY